MGTNNITGSIAGSAATTLEPTLQQLASSQTAGVAFIVGLATALWSASGYVNSFSRAMNRVYEIREGRPVWKLRPVMLLLTAVAVVLVVTCGTLVAGIVGALFAVPVAAVLNTVILYFHGHDKFPDLGFDDHISVRPSGRRAVMITSAERHLRT